MCVPNPECATVGSGSEAFSDCMRVLRSYSSGLAQFSIRLTLPCDRLCDLCKARSGPSSAGGMKTLPVNENLAYEATVPRSIIYFSQISTSDRTHARERTGEEHSRREQHEEQPASDPPSHTVRKARPSVAPSRGQALPAARHRHDLRLYIYFSIQEKAFFDTSNQALYIITLSCRIMSNTVSS